MIEPVIIPTTIGSICRPASVGLDPRTTCRYCGSSEIPPNIAEPTTTEITTPSAKVLLANIRSGISALSRIAFSTSTNPMTPSTPIT